MLWGGRFDEPLDQASLEFSSSLNDDINLFEEEILCGKAYAEMLCQIKIISKKELSIIIQGLNTLDKEWNEGKLIADSKKYEDVHSLIESRLYKLIGNTAGKLRSGRSRNDQVVTSLRMWLKKSSCGIMDLLNELQKCFIQIADKHVDTIIPGYTHLQHAQPVSLAHHLLAYVEMLERDKKRFDFVISQCDSMPLGSGALAGSTLPIDSKFLQKKLGFASICKNSLDGVSDRDFVLDFLNACSTGMMHLSRLSEELILWSTKEWRFIKISDSFTTGSSLMPQKKNPDIAELIRGKASKVFANYQSVIAMLKGLPLSYNRDMQEDKPSVFNSFYIYLTSLKLMNGMMKTVTFNGSALFEKIKNGSTMATDAADWLVSKGIPFKEAHNIIGALVKYSLKNKIDFKDLTVKDLKKVNPVLNKELLTLLKVEGSLQRKKTFGSPNPAFVKKQIAKWKGKL
jgi:argininosuccinate lyase